MSSLTKQQQTTLVYIIGCVLMLLVAGGLLYSLNSSAATVTKLKQDVERKEKQAKGVRPATAEEQSQWEAQETQLGSLLLSEQAVPQFFEEVTRIATENSIQRLSMNSEEVTIDPGKAATADEARVIAVGIKHYLAVTMKFQGQYVDVARFLGSVAMLDRPIQYHLVELKRGFPYIEAQVVINVYKREPA
jgi:Tfp pilus assembly protein PilO